MKFHNFPGLETEILINAMTFQVSRDLCNSCKFEGKSKIKIRVCNIKCNLKHNGFSKKANLTFLVWRGLEKLDVTKEGTDRVTLKSFPAEGGNSTFLLARLELRLGS